jgi:hypothetical protein
LKEQKDKDKEEEDDDSKKKPGVGDVQSLFVLLGLA